MEKNLAFLERQPLNEQKKPQCRADKATAIKEIIVVFYWKKKANYKRSLIQFCLFFFFFSLPEKKMPNNESRSFCFGGITPPEHDPWRIITRENTGVIRILSKPQRRPMGSPHLDISTGSGIIMKHCPLAFTVALSRQIIMYPANFQYLCSICFLQQVMNSIEKGPSLTQ